MILRKKWTSVAVALGMLFSASESYAVLDAYQANLKKQLESRGLGLDDEDILVLGVMLPKFVKPLVDTWKEAKASGMSNALIRATIGANKNQAAIDVLTAEIAKRKGGVPNTSSSQTSSTSSNTPSNTSSSSSSTSSSSSSSSSYNASSSNNPSIVKVYAGIRDNFLIAIDHSKGELTLKDWETFAQNLDKHLSESDPIWEALKQEYAGLKKPWPLWDIFTGKIKADSQLLKGRIQSSLFELLKGISKPSSTFQRPPGALLDYLYSGPEIQVAIASPNRGAGKVIPYFGDYNKTGKDVNGFWYLSNYFVSDPAKGLKFEVSFTFKGALYTFNNIEGAYQAGKLLIAGVPLSPAEIQQYVSANPNQARELARVEKRYKYNAADREKIDAFMKNLVSQKFINSALGAKLNTETGEAELIEGNTWDDAIWGKPFDGVQHVLAQNGPMKGKQGENRLGKILGMVRTEIRKGVRSVTPYAF